jgi:hypothetical protein
MKKNMARETILKILQDPSLKVRKRGIVVKMICPHATRTPRNYMILLLNDKSKLCGTKTNNYSKYKFSYDTNKFDTNDLFPEFAVNLAGNSSTCIGVSKESYIVKPTIQDYLELWDMYTTYKKKWQEIWRWQEKQYGKYYKTHH